MQICCPDKCEIPGLNNKCIVTGKNSEVKGEEAVKLREKLRQQHKQKKLEKKKMNEKQKREDYRYNKEDYGGWGYGGQYNNKITDSFYGDAYYCGGDYDESEFFRPDGDLEGKDVNWCLSNGFFMIEPGLWSGPWYFDQFPQARKENCVGQRGQAEKDADDIIPSTMPQNDRCDDIHYDEFFPAPPYFAEDDDDDSFHLEPVSPTLGRVLVISDEAQSEIGERFQS
eukprot:scaffold360_cov262-Chaetoceros_neogracile.AAC.3